MRKKLHPADERERAEILKAPSFAIYFRRGPHFTIREEGFADLATADLRAREIEAEHSAAGRQCLLYAVSAEGRAFCVPPEMRLEARNQSRG